MAESTSNAAHNSTFKAVGIVLAVSSGFFIGTSFVLKKKGLLAANQKYATEAGEGHAYLKSWVWWLGMTLMIIGEVANFVAYAFTDAILVTPLGALTVVVCAIGSSAFLKERLSFVGKVACALCILGATVIVLNAPSQKSVTTIQEMQKLVIAPGFLAYGGVLIVISIFLVFWAGPRYGKKTMLVYISVCSLIGSLSVVATQGLGAAIVAQAQGVPQFNQWFLYVLLVFVICTLLVEINYLNKALNLFNTSIVTPTYYVYFTSATIVSSAVLFKGFGSSSATVIGTVCIGFLVICCGVILLQMSKAASKVSDTAQLSGDLDDVQAAADMEKGEDDPGADAIRGALSIRRLSTMRRSNRQSNPENSGTDFRSGISLSHRSTWGWNRERPKDGRFLNVPPEWSQTTPTIVEGRSTEEGITAVLVDDARRKSSVHFDPSAPITHIYPPRMQPSNNGRGDRSHTELIEDVTQAHRSQSGHDPLSPGQPPAFMSAPPTPRYIHPVPKYPGVQKQFSFGRVLGRHGDRSQTEEERIGLVLAGKSDGGNVDDDDDDDLPERRSSDSDLRSSVEDNRFEELDMHKERQR